MNWNRISHHVLKSDSGLRISRTMVAGKWKYTLWEKGVDPNLGKNPYESEPYRQIGKHHDDLDVAKAAAEEH